MLFAIAIVTALVLAAVICATTGAFATLMWLWLLPVSGLGIFLGLALMVFLTLWLLCAIVKMDVPQEKDSRFYRTVTYLVVEAAMTILQMRVHTRGLEKTPKSGRFLLVCNHINDMDPVTLLWFFRKSQLAFISKRENDQKFLIGPLMHKLLCQPINRENDKEALKTILKCISIIKEDKASIAVFPEGYTSLDGLLHPFRSGVFKIAQKAKVPIVVCTLQNTQYIFKNAMRLKPTHVQLHLLDVLTPEQFEGLTTVEIGNRVHEMMAEDLGPDLVLQKGDNNEEN